MWPYIVDVGSFRISSYSVCVIIAVVLGIFVFWKRSREEYYAEEEVVDLALYSLFWGIFGGRLLYGMFNLNDFGLNLVNWLSLIKHPGIYWEGVMVGSLLAFVRYTRKKRWNVYKSLDLAVIGVSLMHVWTNLGMFFSGAEIGKKTKLPWGVVTTGSLEKRHPVGLYLAMMWIVIFAFLWWVEGKYRRFIWYQRAKGDAKTGFLFYSYLIAFGVTGIVMVGLTEISRSIAGINLDLLYRLVVLLIGFGGLYWRSGLSLRMGIEEGWNNWFASRNRSNKGAKKRRT